MGHEREFQHSPSVPTLWPPHPLSSQVHTHLYRLWITKWFSHLEMGLTAWRSWPQVHWRKFPMDLLSIWPRSSFSFRGLLTGVEDSQSFWVWSADKVQVQVHKAMNQTDNDFCPSGESSCTFRLNNLWSTWKNILVLTLKTESEICSAIPSVWKKYTGVYKYISIHMNML